MKILTLIELTAAVGLITACSNDDGFTGDPNAMTVNFAAYNGAPTRAHSTTAMNASYLVRITNRDADTLTAERTVGANGTYSTLYWDEISSQDKDVRKSGAKVMALSDPRTTNAIGTIPVDGKLTYKVDADQTTGNMTNDLMIADYIENQSRTSDNIALCFHHALTKITVNLIAGDGIDSATCVNSTVVLPKEYTQAALDLTMATGTDNRKAVKGNAASDLKMERLKTPYTYTVNNKVYKYACSFDAIVAPDKLISNSPNNVLAEIDVAGNIYHLTESQVEEKWGDTLQTGNHYVIAVRVSRTHISCSNAVVTDWKDGGEVTVNESGVIFKNDQSGVASFDKALEKSGFSIYQKEQTANDYGDAAIKYTYDSGTSAWNASNIIYWKDGLTRYYFRGISPVTTPVKDGKVDVADGATDYLYATTPETQWGSETIGKGEPVPPRTGPVDLTFAHVMSKITINFNQMPTSSGGVDVSNVTVTLKSAKTSAVLDLQSGMLGDYVSAAEGYTVSTKTLSCEFYSIPQNLGGLTSSTLDDLYLEITASGNTYRVYLKDIIDIAKNSQQTTIQEWEAGKHYIYTFNRYKKVVNFSASVLDWEDGGTSSGNISL